MDCAGILRARTERKDVSVHPCAPARAFSSPRENMIVGGSIATMLSLMYVRTSSKMAKVFPYEQRSSFPSVSGREQESFPLLLLDQQGRWRKAL